MFNSKGNIVGDLSPFPPARKNRLKPSLSEKDLLSAIDRSDRQEHEIRTRVANTLIIDDKKTERSVSLSPEIHRSQKNCAPEVSLGHIVRVAVKDHDHCNYVSLLVG